MHTCLPDASARFPAAAPVCLAAREPLEDDALSIYLAAASAASAARGGGFDPSSTLPWSVPLMMVAPLVGYVMVLGAVRTRRVAANAAQFTLMVTLLATLLVAWARFRQASPYKVAFQWINIPVAASGDTRFQGFGIDLAFRIDHLALAALVTVEVILIAGLVWQRVSARGEQGPVRYQVNLLLLALGAIGVLVSGDLAELLGFWLLAGIATYLLLGHRWGTEGAGQRGRVALALPFVGDAALLCGVGLLYSRFGTLTLDSLFPALTTTPGVGLKSLTVAAVLIFAAVAVRASVWPFTAWQIATVDAPAAAVATIAGIWPVLAGSLFLRLLPLIGAAGPQATSIAGITLGIAAIAAPLLALVGVEFRRAAILGSAGAVALVLLGILEPGSVGVAVTGLLAVAAGRAAALFALASVAGAMRTVDLRATGGGWSRMPWTSATLLAAAAVVSLGGLGTAMLRPAGAAWIALAAGLALVAVALFRIYFGVAHGPLRRRRAFEPERVREVATSARLPALTVVGLGLAAVVLTFLTGWIGFLNAGGHAISVMGTNVLWIAAPLAGLASAAFVFWRRKDEGLRAGVALGDLTGGLWEQAATLFGRLVAEPGAQAVHAVEDVGIPAAEVGLEQAIDETGDLAEDSIRRSRLTRLPGALPR